MSQDEGYLLNNQRAEAGERFDALSTLLDPVTFRHLRSVGVGVGWRCWEVGAGGASVPRWLAEQVGPTGRVVATDIDTSWMPAESGFEVLRHDVGTDEPPVGPFDLVHARVLLVHVLQCRAALAAMVRALRPGGWLVLEDADAALLPQLCPDESGPAQQLANKMRRGFRQLLAQRGADLAFGRTLPRLLREAGLLDVCADGYFPIASPACTALEAATVRQIRNRLVDADLATDEEIDEHLANVTTGQLDLTPAPLISAWGRKPGTAA
jgi:hypothetical protein